MGYIYQIWTLEYVRDDNQIHANMKDLDDAIIFRSRDFIKAVSPCRKELRSPNFDANRFRGTNLLKTILKNNNDVILARSRDFGKIL